MPAPGLAICLAASISVGLAVPGCSFGSFNDDDGGASAVGDIDSGSPRWWQRLRRDTQAALELIPTPHELARREAADGAAAIAQLAAAAAAGSTDMADDQREALSRLAADSEAHLGALGGSYVSAAPGGFNITTPTAEPPVQVSVPEVVAALHQAAATNFDLADSTRDGGLARLLASIGVAQAVAAFTLDYEASAAWLDTLYFSGPAPAGLTVPDVQALVASLDGARYAFEVAAARQQGDFRALLREHAREFAAAAHDWAILGGIAGTPQDPRQVAYQLPPTLDPAGLVLFIETGMGDIWAGLISVAAPETRLSLIGELLASRVKAWAWGAATPTFPGIPEIAPGEFGGAPLLPDEPRIPAPTILPDDDGDPAVEEIS